MRGYQHISLLLSLLCLLIISNQATASNRIEISMEEHTPAIRLEKQEVDTRPDYLKAVDGLPCKEALDCKLAQTLTLSFRTRFHDVYQEAKNYLSANRREIKRHNGAIVMDLDETVMDNRLYYVVHKQFDQTLWDQWVELAEAPVIPESLEFINWAKRKRIPIFFVSGRKEFQRNVTEKNLVLEGIKGIRGMYLKPDDYNKDSASNFKQAARKDIESKGYKIMAVIGDQVSDLEGKDGRDFKLPNPIYYIP